MKSRANKLVVRGAGRVPGADPLVDDAVVEITRIWNRGLRDTVVAVGEYLIRNFYGGVKAARSQAPVKEASLKQLLDRADELPVSAHGLKMAVGVALFVRELPRPVAGALSASHIEALLPVRDPEVARRLAADAAGEKLTVAELADRVRRAQPPHPGGRARKHPLERGIDAVVRALSSQTVADGLTPAALRELDAEQLAALDIRLRRARELLEQIADPVARRMRR